MAKKINLSLVIGLTILLLLTACSQSGSQEKNLPKVNTTIKEVVKPIKQNKTIEKVVVPVKQNLTNKTDAVKKEPIKKEIIQQKNTNPDLISHWPFDTDAKDAVGSNHGELKGGANTAKGKIGNSLSLDGVDDYVDFPKSTSDELSKLSQGTIMFWFKFQSILDKQVVMPLLFFGMDNENDIDNMLIIEIGHFKDGGFDIQPDPNNKKIYTTWIKNNMEPFLCFDTKTNVAENEWNHFALVVGENKNIGYLNGIELNNRYYNFGTSTDSSFLTDIKPLEKMFIGKGRSSWMISPKFVYFKGNIDDLRIYNKVLLPQEIQKIMRG